MRGLPFSGRKMKIFHLLFSHELTTEQKKEIRDILHCDLIKALPAELQLLWSQVPPEADISRELLQPFFIHLEKESLPEDFVLVQGDYGITCAVVNWCLKNGRVPVYATTRRIASELHHDDGAIETKHIFQHVKFRKYYCEE